MTIVGSENGDGTENVPQEKSKKIIDLLHSKGNAQRLSIAVAGTEFYATDTTTMRSQVNPKKCKKHTKLYEKHRKTYKNTYFISNLKSEKVGLIYFIEFIMK